MKEASELLEQVMELKSNYPEGFERIYGVLLNFELKNLDADSLSDIIASKRRIINSQKIFEASNIAWFNLHACEELYGIKDIDNIPYRTACRIINEQDIITARQSVIDTNIKREQRRLDKLSVTAAELREKISPNGMFEEVPYIFFYWYMPIRMGRVSDYYQPVRGLVDNFKRGMEKDSVSDKISIVLKQFFNDEDLKKMVFCCVPAHSAESTEFRWKEFSRIVCRKTGMKNGYRYLLSQNDHEEQHHGNKVCHDYILDEEFLKGKFIVVFDDIVTTRKTMDFFISTLRRAKANVICCMSLGRTYIDYMGYDVRHPWDSYREYQSNK